MRKIINSYIPFIFFTILLIFGFKNVENFGISFDEHVNRINGGISTNYVLQEINSVFKINLFENDEELKKFNTKLSEYKDRDYGVVVDLPVFLIERIFKINDSKEQYIFRHYLIYILFMVGAISLYKIVVLRYSSMILGLFAVLMMVFSPRVFADAFYNIKDIVFMSMFTMAVLSTIKFERKPSIKNIFIHSICTAMAIDVRIVAVIIPIVTLLLFIFQYFRKEIEFKNGILYLSSYLILTLLFIIIMWPWLWEDPINNFIEAFKNMSRFRWDGWILFRGVYHPASEIPRNYLPTWIILTVPIVYLILFALGGILIIRKVVLSKLRLWSNKKELIDLICLVLFISPIILVVIKKPIIYDGWRQFYFIYPVFVMTAINGLDFIIKSNYVKEVFKKLIYLLIVLQMMVTLNWMYKAYPYWNVYFNALAGHNWGERFERDYWGLSNKAGLDYILANDARPQIFVYGQGHSTIKETLDIIDKKDRERIKIVKDINNANYLIFNYRIFQPNEMDYFKNINSKDKLFYEIKIDENPILTILKLS